jgi:hypothetical protein
MPVSSSQSNPEKIFWANDVKKLKKIPENFREKNSFRAGLI